MTELYMVTKEFQQTDKPEKEPCHNSKGGTAESWLEHFCELINRPTTEGPPDKHPAATNLPIDSNKPSKTDQGSNTAFKTGKATEPDVIPAVLIRLPASLRIIIE